MPADDLRIGDFSRPVTPAPRPPDQAPARTAAVPADAAEAALGAEAGALEAELGPMRSYEEQLREIGVSREEAARIIDAIMNRGFWSEEVSVTRSIRARFRTRNSRDRSRAIEYIENARPAYEAHVQEMMNKQLLAASLESFAGDKFAHADARTAKAEDIEAAFEARFRFVNGVISDPALNLLMRHFHKFDLKIRTVMQEGAVENF
jgi:hypothetical protein